MRAAELLGLVALVGLSACTEVRNPPGSAGPDSGVRSVSSGAWGPLPGSQADVQALIDRRRLRSDLAARPEPDPDEVLALIRRGVERDRVATGWPMIVQRLGARLDAACSTGRDAYLLFGTWHDSGLQLDALRRLIGPAGIGGWSALVIEQFDADGCWAGVGEGPQRGDDDDLAAWNESADRSAFGRLRLAQQRDDYTAYKYGNLDRVMDLLVTARAAGVDVLGCDMPAGLQRRLQSKGLEDLTRLREVHCLLALADRLTRSSLQRPIRVAMLWGQDHVAPGSVPSLLPPQAEVVPIYAVGGRPVDHGLAAELGARLAITGPMLVPLEADAGYLLLLPGDRLGARVERRRLAILEQGRLLPTGKLEVHCAVPGELTLRQWKGPVEGTTHLRSAAGQAPFLFVSPAGALAGGVQVPAGGSVELELDPAERRVDLVEHVPGAHP